MNVALKHSAFLSGTSLQLCYDSTSIGWLKECPRKYFYHMICGYQPHGEGVHLKFGLVYHEATELYDKLVAEDYTHEVALRHAVSYALDATVYRDEEGNMTGPWIGNENKNRETLIRTIVWYYSRWEEELNDGDPIKTVILANGKPAVELSFKMELDLIAPNGQAYILAGHLDKIGTFIGSQFITDKKTTKYKLESYYFNQFSPDNQMSTYSLAAKVIFGMPVKGVIIDATQVLVGFNEYKREVVYRTEEQLLEWVKDTHHYIRQAEQYAEQNYWPMNDKACHNYGGCPFRGVCSRAPNMRDRILAADFSVREWNPMEAR
jgi:hypothetical protein